MAQDPGLSSILATQEIFPDSCLVARRLLYYGRPWHGSKAKDQRTHAMWTGWSIMGHWHHLGLAVGITALVGCGTPTPDAPMSGHTSGSADPVVSLSAGGASRTGLTAYESARQAPTQTSPLGPPAQHASTPEARITDATRGTSPAHDVRVQTAAAPADPPLSDERADADQAQQEARQRWFAEMQESPSAAVRLQALELWAQQPSDALDPETFALLDDVDAQVRARAEQLWEQQLSREAGATAP